jgi:osmoprotectant transport system substrate-binding protein
LIAAQNVVPLIRKDKATDAVTEVLDAVSAALTTEELLELNERNQGDDKEAPAALAKEWVAENVK